MKLSLKLFGLLAIFLLGFFIFYRWALLPVDSDNKQATIFVVPQGQSATSIAQRLERDGLIKNSFVFKLLINRQGVSNKLQAGDFRLSPSMNLSTVIESLTHGSLDYWITFPEGLRAEQYAEKLAKEAVLNPQEFILAAKPFEGQLFPDTYLIPQTASAEDIVSLLVSTFEQKSPTQNPDTIIIASLIEREAKHAEDRPLVSSVLHNRIKLGMALQIDATVQFVLGTPNEWWPQNLTREDLQISSPYNTYLNFSLPPKPIANPGLAALKAAVNPTETNYLYYVSDSGGYNHYAEDLEGHNKNIETYLNQ